MTMAGAAIVIARRSTSPARVAAAAASLRRLRARSAIGDDTDSQLDVVADADARSTADRSDSLVLISLRLAAPPLSATRMRDSCECNAVSSVVVDLRHCVRQRLGRALRALAGDSAESAPRTVAAHESAARSQTRIELGGIRLVRQIEIGVSHGALFTAISSAGRSRRRRHRCPGQQQRNATRRADCRDCYELQLASSIRT